MTNAGRACVLGGTIVGLDQLTKAILRGGVERGERKDVLPGVDLVHTHNDGIAWGFFSGGGSGVIVPVATAIAVGALLWWFWTFRDKPWVWLPIGMILGGAIGNAIDRVTEGAVTDFLDIPVLPPFNLADASITLGLLAALWGFDWVLDDQKKQRAEADDERRATNGAV